MKKMNNNKKFDYVEPDGYIPKKIIKKLGLDKPKKNSNKKRKFRNGI